MPDANERRAVLKNRDAAHRKLVHANRVEATVEGGEARQLPRLPRGRRIDDRGGRRRSDRHREVAPVHEVVLGVPKFVGQRDAGDVRVHEANARVTRRLCDGDGLIDARARREAEDRRAFRLEADAALHVAVDRDITSEARRRRGEEHQHRGSDQTGQRLSRGDFQGRKVRRFARRGRAGGLRNLNATDDRRAVEESDVRRERQGVVRADHAVLVHHILKAGEQLGAEVRLRVVVRDVVDLTDAGFRPATLERLDQCRVAHRDTRRVRHGELDAGDREGRNVRVRHEGRAHTEREGRRAARGVRETARARENREGQSGDIVNVGLSDDTVLPDARVEHRGVRATRPAGGIGRGDEEAVDGRFAARSVTRDDAQATARAKGVVGRGVREREARRCAQRAALDVQVLLPRGARLGAGEGLGREVPRRDRRRVQHPRRPARVRDVRLKGRRELLGRDGAHRGDDAVREPEGRVRRPVANDERRALREVRHTRSVDTDGRAFLRSHHRARCRRESGVEHREHRARDTRRTDGRDRSRRARREDRRDQRAVHRDLEHVVRGIEWVRPVVEGHRGLTVTSVREGRRSDLPCPARVARERRTKGAARERRFAREGRRQTREGRAVAALRLKARDRKGVERGERARAGEDAVAEEDAVVGKASRRRRHRVANGDGAAVELRTVAACRSSVDARDDRKVPRRGAIRNELQEARGIARGLGEREAQGARRRRRNRDSETRERSAEGTDLGRELGSDLSRERRRRDIGRGSEHRDQRARGARHVTRVPERQTVVLVQRDRESRGERARRGVVGVRRAARDRRRVDRRNERRCRRTRARRRRRREAHAVNEEGHGVVDTRRDVVGCLARRSVVGNIVAEDVRERTPARAARGQGKVDTARAARASRNAVDGDAKVARLRSNGVVGARAGEGEPRRGRVGRSELDRHRL